MICKQRTASYLCCSTLHTCMSWVNAGIPKCKGLKLQAGYALATVQPDSCLCTQTTVAGNGYVIQPRVTTQSAYGVGGHHISIYHRPHSIACGLWYAEVGKTQNLVCVALAVSLFRFHSRHCLICCTDWTVMLISSCCGGELSQLTKNQYRRWAVLTVQSHCTCTQVCGDSFKCCYCCWLQKMCMLVTGLFFVRKLIVLQEVILENVLGIITCL